MPPPTLPTRSDRVTFEHEQCLIPELAMLGWSRFSRAQASLGAHYHSGGYEICYIVHGRVDWWAMNEMYEVGAGDVYITRPDEVHGGQDAMMHPNELYWLLIRLPDLASLPGAETASLATDFQSLRLRTFPGSPIIRECFARLIAEHQERGHFASLMARASLQQLLVTVVRDHARHAGAIRDQRLARSRAIRRALTWMKQHLADEYRVTEVAAAADLSVSHFHDQFVKEVGLTPADYRARMRVNRAKQLLRAGEMPITDIAMSLGFSTSQYFATVFKNLSGLTPREYRSHFHAPLTKPG